MSTLLGSDFFVIPAVAISVFIFSYLMSGRIINFIYEKSIGTREEVANLLDKMYIETDKDRLTLMVLLLSVGLGFIFFLLLWPNLFLGLIVAIAVTFGGWSLPKVLLNFMWEKRCDRLVEQMVDGLTIMANGVKAGISITQSMERVVDNMSGPLAQEFQVILNKIALGMTVEDALNDFGNRIPRQDVQMLVTAVNILKETGGRLAETFETIVFTVRERQKIEKKIDALTSQGVMQGVIITLVPFILLIVFLVIDPNYIMPLFTKPLGWFALFLMLGLQVMGGIMMKKVVTIKV